MAQKPVVTKPVDVVDAPGITVTEYFGRVATKDSTTSFARAKVKGADAANFQAPQFSEYVICTSGCIELEHSDSTRTRVEAGQGVFLPKGLRIKWTWPGAAEYLAVCLPAFSPELAGTEVDDSSGGVVDQEARRKLAKLHQGAGAQPEAEESGAALDARPIVVKPVDVVSAEQITITEHFGHVASSDGTASFAIATVKSASEEAFQAPQFDEYVVCIEGAIDFFHESVEGVGERTHVQAGEAVFLPKGLRVKWIWPEPTKYAVLCLPAFSPAISGREAEEGATVAKDSASMSRLEDLHKSAACGDSAPPHAGA
mmetsp:Transcript_89483/g.191788  ORF Transcript_89483/g.191788 Transcript_89483/m.191788 type:complete len:313 (-) Transcript_89483:80-1018(-)